MVTYTELTNTGYLHGAGYFLGDGNVNPIGSRDETVTESFNHPVNSAQIRLGGLNTSPHTDQIGIHVNGQVYNLTAAHLSNADLSIIINGNGFIINIDTSCPNQGVTITITVPGGISSVGLQYAGDRFGTSGAGVLQHLRVGQEILTLDHGYQKLLLIASLITLRKDEHRPICIKTDAFGPGLSLTLGFNVNWKRFSQNEDLIQATKIQMLPGVDICTETTFPFEYFRHVIQVSGIRMRRICTHGVITFVSQ